MLLETDCGLVLPVEISDKGDGAYTCKYTPPTAGLYRLSITSCQAHIRNSPFSVQVSLMGTDDISVPLVWALLPVHKFVVNILAG